MLDRESLGVFSEVARKLDNGFARLPAFQNQTPEMGRLAEVLGTTAERLKDNYPYFHPLYAGQMLKPPPPGGAAGVCAGHVAQSEQSRAGWRAGDLGDGKRGGCRDRRDVRLEEFSRPLVQRWDDGQSRSLMGRGTTACGEKDSGQRAGALYASADQRCLCSCRSKLSRATRRAGWTRTCWQSALSAATSEPLLRQWGPRPRARWIHYRTFSLFAKMHGFRVHCGCGVRRLFRAHGKS